MIRLENFVTLKHITLLTKPMMYSVVQRVCQNCAKISEEREYEMLRKKAVTVLSLILGLKTL